MMRPQEDAARRCRKLADWPEADQAAWKQAMHGRDLFDESRSPAAAWRADTADKNRRGYGRWLTFLINAGTDLSQLPPCRITPPRIAAYLEELKRHGLRAYTRRARILELYAVAKALWPAHDWVWLKRCVGALDRLAAASARANLPPFLSNQIEARALHELRCLKAEAAARPVAYRNWLMLGLISLAPLRLRNFAGLEIGHTLKRQPDGGWQIDLAPGSTKTGRPHRHPITAEVAPLLDHYLAAVRPLFRPVDDEQHLWLSMRGAVLAQHTIHIVLRELTEHAFGTAIGPHFFRHIFASSVSVLAPELIDGARAALGHSSRLTTQHHYVRAGSLAAARRHARIVLSIRRRTRRGKEKGESI